MEWPMTDTEKVAALEKALSDLCRATKHAWAWRRDGTVLIEREILHYTAKA
jgi:hypothetical protein